MPYKIVEFPGKGYKVGLADGKKMSNGRFYLSNKYLTKEKAQTQMKAVSIGEKMIPKLKPFKKRRVKD